MAYSASFGSSKKVVPKYVKFMVLEKISECKRTINFIVGEVQNATSHLEHLNGMIEMLEGMHFTLEIYDSVWCLREMVKSENKKLNDLNKQLLDAEEDIRDFVDENMTDDMPVLDEVVFKIHKNGYFELDPLRYVNGSFSSVSAFTCDRDIFPSCLNWILSSIPENIWALFYCLPNTPLEKGLKLIHTDNDVLSFFAEAERRGKIHLYVTHKQQALGKFYLKNMVWLEEDASLRCSSSSPFSTRIKRKSHKTTKDCGRKNSRGKEKMVDDEPLGRKLLKTSRTGKEKMDELDEFPDLTPTKEREVDDDVVGRNSIRTRRKGKEIMAEFSCTPANEKKVVVNNYRRALINGKYRMVEVADVGLVEDELNLLNKKDLGKKPVGSATDVQEFPVKCTSTETTMEDLSLTTAKSFSNPIYAYFARTNEVPANYFVFEVHYNGVFSEYPLRYEHGKTLTLKLSKSNKMLFSKMLDMLSYKLECHIWAIFVCSPRCSLGEGLTIVEDDGDMEKLYAIAEKYGLVNFYIAHIPENLAEYYFKNLTLDASDEEVKSKVKSHEKRKLDASAMSPHELVDWAEQEAGSPYLRTPPIKPRRKGIEFPCKNLFADFLHCDSVADEIVLHDNWKYEGLSLDGPIDVGGPTTWCDLVHECVVENGDSLPIMDKECFSNNVVLDDVVPANRKSTPSFCNIPIRDFVDENMTDDMPVLDEVVFKIHKNGYFELDPLRYVNGSFSSVSAFTCDRDIFPSCLNWILSSIPENIWALFYCLPNTPLEKGLKLIHTDNDVLSFFAEAERRGKIHLYVTHKQQALGKFYLKNMVWLEEDASLRCSSSSPFSTRIKRKSHKTTKDCGRKNSRGKEKMVDDEPLGRKLLKTSRMGKEKMDELDEFPDLTPTKEREVDDDVVGRNSIRTRRKGKEIMAEFSCTSANEKKVVVNNYKRALINGKYRMVEVADVVLVEDELNLLNKKDLGKKPVGSATDVQEFPVKAETNEVPANYFVFKVYYNGVFSEYPLRYEHGKTLTLKLSKSNKMLFSKMLDMLSYKLECHIWAIFVCFPRCSLSEGLTIIEDDGDMEKLYAIAEKYGLVNFYIAHIPENLAEYYFKNLTLDASDEEVKSKVKSHEKRKLDAYAMSPHELVDWTEQEAGSPYLRTPPIKPRRKGIEFPCKNLFADFLHCDSVADEIVLHDNWKYEGLSLDGPIDVGGPTTWCDLVHECVVENGDSLPIMDKECFSNNVVLDDVVPANRKSTPLLLMKKGRNKVSFTRKSRCVKNSKTFSLRKGCGKRVACGANTRRLGGLMGLNVQTFRARKGWGKRVACGDNTRKLGGLMALNVHVVDEGSMSAGSSQHRG
ncbi:hypothetical protein Tco_0001532 [Tanacetum coccineum]